MPIPKPPDWAAIRRRYEATDAAAADIASEAGIVAAEFERMRKRGRWRRQKPRGATPGRKPASPPAPKPVSAADPALDAQPRQRHKPSPKQSRRRAGTSTPTGRRRLLERLVALISLKLQQLERRMESDLDRPDANDPASATDHERETRAIGALIDNLGKVTEMETGIVRAATSGKSATAADLAGEADRYRRELAERLRKIIDAAAAKP